MREQGVEFGAVEVGLAEVVAERLVAWVQEVAEVRQDGVFGVGGAEVGGPADGGFGEGVAFCVGGGP